MSGFLAEHPDLARPIFELAGVEWNRRTGSEYRITCPFHADEHPSLDINPEKAVFLCRSCGKSGDAVAYYAQVAGVSPTDAIAEIKRRLGLGNGSATSPPQPATPNPTREIAATYDYRDETSALLFQVLRYVPKGFKQRRPDGNGGWIWNLDCVRRVLYRLPELLSVKPDRVVFVCEGEKDAERLAALGFVATTAPGGAGKWQPEFSDALRGRRVVIPPDNDTEGAKHAEAVARSLHGVAGSVRVLELPGLPPKGDVSDWLNAGGSRGELKRLATEAPEWTPPDAVPIKSRAVTVRMDQVEPEKVEWLWPGRVPFGKLVVLDGDPGLGKSTLTLDLAARLSTGTSFPDGSKCAPAGAVILSAEDGLADTIRPRLDAAGADLSRIVALTAEVDEANVERFPTLSGSLLALEEAIFNVGARLVLIDPLMAYVGAGVNSWKDQDMRGLLAPLAKLADRTGAAVLMIRHLNKVSIGQPLHRGGGSIGIIGAARAGLLVAKDPDDEQRRVLAVFKSNLCAPPPHLAFRLQPRPNGVARIAWDDAPVRHSVESLLAATLESEEDRSVRGEAMEFLEALLKDGPRPSKEVEALARGRGISTRTFDRAKRDLGVVSEKAAIFGGAWQIRLPSAAVQRTPLSYIGEVGVLREIAKDFEGEPDGLASFGNTDDDDARVATSEDDPEEVLL